MSDPIFNYADAKDEAERLSRNLKRDVEVRTDTCCDFDPSCGTCYGPRRGRGHDRYLVTFTVVQGINKEPQVYGER